MDKKINLTIIQDKKFIKYIKEKLINFSILFNFSNLSTKKN